MNGRKQTGRQGISTAAMHGLGLSCPECGGRLMRTGMCFTCVCCGWGECG